ncbi:MAG: hypothetical protein K5907_10325 [Treponema sp.]|nr:hypothetical protein [Treponema sp.]
MKLDPVFTVKQNKLFFIESNSPADVSTFNKIEIKWSEVELEDEMYNEEYLAALREQLKALDESGKFAILIPVVDKPLESPEQIELFINAFNHTARRVKDCVSVAGLELPPQIIAKGFSAGSPAADFMETLAIKHAQYVYFVKGTDSIPDNIAVY